MTRDGDYQRVFGEEDRERNAAGGPAAVAPEFEEEVGCLQRRDGAIRIRAKTWEGRPFIDVRFFSRGADGGFYPTGKGLGIRMQEARDVAAAIQRAIAVLDARRPTTR